MKCAYLKYTDAGLKHFCFFGYQRAKDTGAMYDLPTGESC